MSGPGPREADLPVPGPGLSPDGHPRRSRQGHPVLIVLNNISKEFPRRGGKPFPAVKGLSLAIESGELLVLVGPSGCGKTTLLRLIAGLEQPSTGSIAFDGQVMTGIEPQDRDVAMVFQESALLPHLTARENIALGLRIRGVARATAEERIREAFAVFGLDRLAARWPAELSGGEGQRVALARALVRRPRVILLDEPLAGLDAPVRVILRREIVELQRRSGATMIHVTHDQAEALSFGSRIAVMDRGVIQQVGLPEELYHSPVSAFVAGFVGSPPMNLFRGTLVRQGGALWFHERTDSGAGVTVCLTEHQSQALDSQAGKELQLGLRPEHIVDAELGQAAPYGSEVEARVTAVELLGHESLARCRVGTGNGFTLRTTPGRGAGAGEVCSLLFDMSRAYFFDASGKLIHLPQPVPVGRS